MARMILDTETTSLDKPFCYDIGYEIVADDFTILTQKHYIVEQVWHNLPLFESAYYKEKRPLYVNLMRTRKAILDKFGYIMQKMRKDIINYNVTDVYAYNSDFDDKVIAFNCDWYKVNNPLESIPIHDIWGYASAFITYHDDYKKFCEDNKFFTDTGNYKGSAEVVYRYITNDVAFEEAHMGLNDVTIEAKILEHCINLGAKFDFDYKVNKILPRKIYKPYKIKINSKIIHEGKYCKKYIRNDVYTFTE